VRLVYAERHDEIEPAIARERLVKKWRREWKFALIEAENPDWRDCGRSGSRQVVR
jgi:putative endonuclease